MPVDIPYVINIPSQLTLQYGNQPTGPEPITWAFESLEEDWWPKSKWGKGKTQEEDATPAFEGREPSHGNVGSFYHRAALA